MKLIYLATPYSHDDPRVRTYRFDVASRVAAHLVKNQVLVYSPITIGHVLWMYENELPTDEKFWREYNYRMMLSCNELWILQLEGWHKSKGVKEEIRMANELELRVRYIPIVERKEDARI